MKIKFLDSVAGASFAYRRNQVVDLRIDIARGFVKAGQAVIVPDAELVLAREEPVETATAPAPEVATKRGGRRRNLRNLGGLLGGA